MDAIELSVNMTVHSKSDDVLISFDEGLVSDSPFVETLVAGWDVTHDDTDLTIDFHLGEELFQPVEFFTGIVSLTPQIEVPDIAWLCVQCNNTHLVIGCAI